MSILGIIAGVAVALMGVGIPVPAPDIEPRSPIHILAHSHEVRFPERVVFNMEAESDSPITAIQLFYTLSGGNIQVYGYPEFAQDTHVTAEFTIKTAGASYVPTGVEIDYFYRITDAKGNTFETDRYSLEYRDPRFRWNKLTRGDLVVLWHDLPRERVEKVAAYVDQRLAAVKSMFGLEDVAPMKAVIVNSRREARAAFPYTSDTATRQHLFGGFAFGEYRLFVMQGLSPDTMIHESTHLLLDQAVDSPMARVPSWLNEGLAMYFEAGSRKRAPIVERAVRSDSLLRLRNMGSQPGRPRDVSTFYAQSWSVVDYLVDTYGADRMIALLAAIDDGDRIDKAVVRTYGLTLDGIERQWKSRIVGETTVVPRPDPGTVGTSALISGAVMVALVASTWRWLWRWLRGPQAAGQET